MAAPALVPGKQHHVRPPPVNVTLVYVAASSPPPRLLPKRVARPRVIGQPSRTRAGLAENPRLPRDNDLRMAPRGDLPGEELSDAEVLANSLTDPHAFGELFERHFDAIFWFLARRAGSDAAQDLAADVFLVAFRSRSRFDLRRADALPWLYGIAANLLRNRLRADQRRGEAEGALAALVVRSSRDDPDLELVRVREDLRRALLQLPERDREILLLSVWEDLSYEGVAQALDLPIGTVKSRLYRARRALDEHFGASRQYRTGGELS